MRTLDDYSVNAVKHFQGREGDGFNANLLYKGKKVAFAIDSADGGQVDFHWENKDEEAEFDKIAEVQPLVKDDMFPEGYQPDAEWIISDLVSLFDNTKRMKRAFSQKTLFVNEGDLRSINAKFTDACKMHIKGKYPDAVILNELSDKEAFKLYYNTEDK